MIAVLILSLAGASIGEAGNRPITPLDAVWHVHRGDVPNGEAVAFDDRDWPTVTLPFTVNGADGEDGGGYYRGASWYRRTLDVAARPAGRRAFLQFDGVALTADVYVNGHKVGHHEGGYASFRIDVTDALRVGTNQIAVRADTARDEGIAPLGGDFTVFGGIYRPVSLVETASVHIDLLDHGGPGVYGRQRTLTNTTATVEASVRVANDEDRPRTIWTRVVAVGSEGATAATALLRVTVPARAVREVALPLTIDRPHRWDGRRDPYLYTLTASLSATRDGAATDRVTVPLGLRTIAFDPAHGLLLNGRPYALHGVNYFHPERPGVGTAVTPAQVDADMAILDDLGVTGLRLVHFQHPQRVYEDADRMGLPVWTEIPLNGAIGKGDRFRADVEEQMRELIRQNYNHPSVILWGLGNEVYSTDPAVSETLRAVASVAHEEDNSRPTTYAHCCQPDDDPKAIVSDVIGFNRYFGWYGGQENGFDGWANGYHRRFPDRSFAVSEYGAGGSIRQQQEPPPAINHPDSGWHPEQAQTAYHIRAWRQLRDLDFLFGTFVWVGFDLASDGRHEGDRPGINDKGLVSYDRAVRKDAFYWYQANWSNRPVLHVLGRRLTPRSDMAVDVTAVSNAQDVALSVNGVVLGSAPVVDHIATFPAVLLKPGPNHLVMSSNAEGGAAKDEFDWLVTPPSAFGVSATPPIEPARARESKAAPPGQ